MSSIFGGEVSRNPKFFETKETLRTFGARLGVIQALPTTYVKVFDMYRGQGVVDFKAAKTGGYEMVILKATEGLATDSMFSTNWQKALDADMLVGVYHFFRSNMDGKAQADYHLNVVRPLLDVIDYKLFSSLDIETTDGINISTRQSRANTYWNTTKPYVLPGCYTSATYWQSLMGNMTLPSWVYGWLAAWNSGSNPKLPVGWTEAQTKYWQYGVYDNYPWAEPVPGVNTDVDVDRWFGTLESLNIFLAKETIPPISHDHPELESRINSLSNEVNTLKARVTALEQARVYFLVEEDLANTYRVKELNTAKKPVMVPANDLVPKVQYSKGSRVQIIPMKVDADGTVNYWKIVGKELYLREQDGYVELY